MQAVKIAGPVLKQESTEELVKKARETLDIISKFLLHKEFFYFWHQYMRRRVVFDPRTNGIAYTNDFEIAIGRSFLELGFDEQLHTILHEISHCILRHGLQQAVCLKRLGKNTYDRNIVKIVHNLVSDAIVDGLLSKTFEAKGIKNSGAENRKEITEKVNSVVGEDVIKLGMMNAIDRIVYKVKTNEIELKAYAPSGAELDLRSGDIDDFVKTYGVILVVIENKKTGGRIELVLAMDIHGAQLQGGHDETKGEESGEGDETSESGAESSKNTKDRGKGSKCCKRGQPGDKAKDSRSEDADSGSCDKGGRIVVKDSIGGESPKDYGDLDRIDAEARELEREMSLRNRNKTAGAGYATWEVFELQNLKDRIPPWRGLLRRKLLEYMQMFKIFTSRIPHPVAPDIFPGYLRFDNPDIVVMLDVSGSMLDGDLEKALSDIIGLVESEPLARITLYTWSSNCSLPQRIDRTFVYNLRTRKKIAINTGGTEIIPALKQVLKDIKPPRRPFVIIMTDGVIYDIETEEAQKLLQELVKKSNTVLFVSTEAIPKLPREIISIRI